MGINPGTLDMVVDWAKQFGALPLGASVLDIGTSQLFCEDDPAALNRFLVHFGADPYENEALAQMAKGGLAGRLFQRAGFHYRAVDITPYPQTLRIDLNVTGLPFWHRRRYALVMNCGTTEHVLNQLNAFRLIHDATAVGGLMYHGVPMAGDFSHGFLSYHPKVFTRMQETNGYEMLARWIWTAEERKAYFEVELASVIGRFEAQDAWVHFLMRRKSKAPFKIPTDLVESG
jgi:hypothetical protein